MYQMLVLVHIAAAVLLVGGSVMASPGVRAAVRRARTTEEMRAYLAIGRPLAVIEPASAFVVLTSGLYLTNVAGFWTQGWVQVAIACWAVNAAIAVRFVKPAISRVAAFAAGTEGLVSRELDAVRWSRPWSIGGDALMANDAAMLYVMTIKPSLAASLLVVIAMNVAVAAVRAGSYRRMPLVRASSGSA